MDNSIIKIQKVFRGYYYRSRRLPLILYIIQKYLQTCNIMCSSQTEDGRVNSSIDEDNIIKILVDKFNTENKTIIKVPKSRMWFDILVFDNLRGWLPVNIKTTKMLSSDNTGNLAMCVHAYTDHKLDLYRDNTYENGEMSVILINKLKKKRYNTLSKKDYFFIVLNKISPIDIIVNSILGLEKITPNLNNLPFQVCWDKNRTYKKGKIEHKIEMFINCLQKNKQNWREIFLKRIQSLKRKMSCGGENRNLKRIKL